MLYAIGLGPGDKKLLTLKAVEIIKSVDEVIVPGKLAYELIKEIREPRIVEFPMGKGKEVAKLLAKEIAEKNGDIAFCCLGDPTLYSTFHQLYRELTAIKPNIEIEIIPGITSVSCALAKAKVFVERALLISTPEFEAPDVAAILKTKEPKKVEKELKSRNFNSFWFLEKMFTSEEKFSRDLPEKADYFSIVVAKV